MEKLKLAMIGCGAIVLLGGIAAVALGLWAARGLKNLEAELKDPVARTAKVKEMLGTDHIPEGYNAMLGVRIPLLAEIVILTDEPPDQDGQIHDLGERSMIYVNVISLGKDEQELRDYFEGKTDDPRVLGKNGINIDVDDGSTAQDTTLSGTWNGPSTSTGTFASFNDGGGTLAEVSLAHVAYWNTDIGATARTKLATGVP